MALDTFAPEYYSQDFAPSEMFEFMYMMFATDRSGMVPPGGNQASWPDVEGSVKTQTYVSGTDLADGEGQDLKYTLAINKSDAVSIPLDDIHRVQRMPRIMAEYMTQADRELLWKINANLRTEFQKATRLAASGLTEPMRGDHEGLTSNVKVLTVHVAGSSNSVHNVWGTAAARQELIAAMDVDAATFAKRHGWVSQNADTKGVGVFPMEVASEVRRYLIDDKPNLGVGGIVDSAFGMGKIPKISGWEVAEDVTLGAINFGTVANIKARINFMHPQRRGLFYGRQLVTMMTEVIQKQFGSRLKGLHLHGGVQGAARHMYGIQIKTVA